MLDVVRRVAVFTGLAVMLAIGAVTAADAKGKKSDNGALPEDLVVFVLGNTIFTLFHELGHALIDKLEIPVLGREEDAVDALAVLMMLPEEEDPAAEQMILAAADGHLMAYDQEEDDEGAFWDEHSLDLQRYAAIHCLVFGSDPEGWAELAELVEMPAEQQERCPGIFDQTQASWDRLLDQHFRAEGDTSGGKVTLRFKKPGAAVDRRLVDLLKKSEALKAVVALVSELFVLPGDFDVVFESCEDVNAYYFPETGNISMCYELVGYFAELYANEDSEE